ncbi:proline--tRNA ligase [Salinisphaera hydrothermalis]|uniref:Proline--tRNA ligase n=1 Tax=Salinisphaera hydrothermalis (strain C41B8) TaxID=1304275 RepID=A0A084IQV4_SALHC|nr:proline--tRNA ligase [Salinisphaera hydrothermalis]KEZ79088.1 prolyl-tRNA synthetase [Salinisphaera hydrothermalis C41B8]
MRLSAFALATTKETPADAEIVSHQLMLRAGMIRRLAAGLYSWSPLGMRVLRKVENIVRAEMDAIGALEMLMPAIQPAELWRESGRWDAMGPLMLRMTDRAEREYCFGPTHEEVITDYVKRDVRSYKQLPVTYYQIQTKFRDEIRPRFGLMRAREFIMKDAYSFHMDAADLDREYRNMRGAYHAILDRMGLDYRVVAADSGDIGGAKSEEFHVLALSGEDELAVSTDGAYAANIEAAKTVRPEGERAAPTGELKKIETPGVTTIAGLAEHMGVPESATAKSIVVMGESGDPVLLMLRGDHSLNEIKAQDLEGVVSPLTMADEATIRTHFGAGPGSIGPVNTNVTVIADYALANASDMVVGANYDGAHFTHFNWGRDHPEPQFADLRNVNAGDASPTGTGTLEILRGIEVGHVFQLGDKYSRALDLSVLDESGNAVVPEMGCYGFGVSRIVAAAIEQCHDDAGICWPQAIAPFDLVIIPIKADKSAAVREACETLYTELKAAGVDVAYDDRGLRPGPMFADAELIGVPHRIVVSDRGLESGKLEYKGRRDEQSSEIDHDVAAIKAVVLGG